MKRILTAIVSLALVGLYGCFETTPTDPGQNSKTPQYTLDIESSGGSVKLSPSGGTYDSGTEVTLTPKADSGYEFAGWDGDLSGSDNPAKIRMTSDKSVTANFEAVGSGTDDTSGIHGTISKDTVWDKTSRVYHIDGELTINADVTWGKKIKVIIDDDASVNVNGNGKLTIEEGVEVKLGTNSSIEVGYSTAGTIITEGSDSLMITFTKNTGVGNWGSTNGGIILNEKTTTTSILDYCIIEYATNGIRVGYPTAVITNCNIRKNKNLGINFAANTMPKDSASFVNDSITDNGGYPISICPEGLTSLSGNTYFDGNTKEGILVTGSSSVTKSGTWKRHSVPYIFDAVASIGSSTGAKITIEPGVVCKFNTGKNIEAGYNSSATIVAIGTDSLPITFTKDEGVENWGSASAGIYLWTKTTNQTVFDHCIIEYATTGIHIDALPAVITNCNIRNNAKYGIYFNSNSAATAMPKDSASFVGDSISDNGSYPIRIAAEGLTRLSGDTYIKNNENDEIEVTGGNVTETGTWKKHSVPYLFTAYVNMGVAAGVKITINPGVVCKFVEAAYMSLGYNNPATLIAEGTDKDSIIFTNKLDGAAWGDDNGGFIFWGKTTQNTSLKYCVIENAKVGMEVDAKISMSNCSVRNNTGAGIVFKANGSPKDSASFLKNSFTGNKDYGIKIYASNVGNLSGTEVVNPNDKPGIYVTGNSVTADAIWKYHNGAPYVVDGTVIIESSTGTTLTIRPKTTLEFTQGSYFRVGYANTATLIADGTAPEDATDPELYTITFTSNSKGVFWGADESDDGAGIQLWDKTTGNTLLKNCYITSATKGVYIGTKNAVTIQNCNIDANQTYGIGYFNVDVPITKITDNTGTNPSGLMVNLHP
jgi:hypothetical protein